MKIFETIENERDLKKLFYTRIGFYGPFGQLRVEFELKKCPNFESYSVKAQYGIMYLYTLVYLFIYFGLLMVHHVWLDERYIYL